MKSLDEALPKRTRRKIDKPATAAGLRILADMQAQAKRSAEKRATAFETGIRKEWRNGELTAAPRAAQIAEPPRPVVPEIATEALSRLEEDARIYRENKTPPMVTKAGLVACGEREARLIAAYVECSQYSPLETITGLGATARSLDTDSRAFVLENLKPYRCIYARSVCIVDVDLNDPLGASVAAERSELLALVHRFVAINPEYGFRCYATAGGLRYIVTSRLLEASTQDPYDMMWQLRADPRYIAMCGLQEMFAARIDPKPERCFEKPEKYAVAKFLWHEGNTAIHHDALQVVKLHDRETAAHEERPLA